MLLSYSSLGGLFLLGSSFLAVLTPTGEASVFGIDFGGEYIKLAGPKNNNIDVILNEQSHRKSPNFIGFRADERYFSSDAKSLAPRFPDNMFPAVNLLVGTGFNNTARLETYREELFHRGGTIVPVEQNESNPLRQSTQTVALKTGKNPVITYTAETLTGMLFSFMQRTVKLDVGQNINTAVVTVPASFDWRQRQALVDAAKLGGVEIVGIMHVTTAAALQYGIQNRGFENDITMMVYDMGAYKTDVGVYTFTAPPNKTKGKKVKNIEAYGTLKLEALATDKTLGGRAFDACIAKMIEDRYVKQKKKAKRVLGGETEADRKAVISLMRAANKVKETLSANSFINIDVEGIQGSQSFQTKVTREDFETECTPLFERSVAVAKKAAEMAGIEDLTTLDAVELMGGGARVPKILDGLNQWRGKTIDRTLNSDEAAALGAGYYAGMVSGRFHMKSFKVVESAFASNTDMAYFFQLEAKDGDQEDETKIRRLYSANSNIGSRKSITVKRDKAFTVKLYLAPNSTDFSDPKTALENPDVSLESILNVTGVERALGEVRYYKKKKASKKASKSSADEDADLTDEEKKKKETDDLMEKLKKMKDGDGKTNIDDLLKEFKEEKDGEEKKDDADADAASTQTEGEQEEEEEEEPAGPPQLNHENNSHSIRIEFRVGDHGIIQADSVDVQIKYVKNITRKVKVNKTEEEYEEEVEQAKKTTIERFEAAEKSKAERLAKKKAEEEEKAKAEAADGDAEQLGDDDAEKKATEEEEETKKAEEEPEKKAEDEGEEKKEGESDEEASSEENSEENGGDDEKKDKKKKKNKKEKKKLTPEEQREKDLTEKIDRAVKLVKEFRMESVTEEELQSRNVAATGRQKPVAFPIPLTKSDMKTFSAILSDFDAADALRRKVAKTKNNLESFLIWVKTDGILESEQLKELEVLTETDRETIAAQVKNHSDWLEDDATDATTWQEYQQRQDDLKELIDPVKKRLDELLNPKKAEEKKAEEAEAEADEARIKKAEESDATTDDASSSGEEKSEDEGEEAASGDDSEKEEDSETKEEGKSEEL